MKRVMEKNRRGRFFILLHANIKKKNKTDKNDLEISRERMLNYK